MPVPFYALLCPYLKTQELTAEETLGLTEAETKYRKARRNLQHFQHMAEANTEYGAMVSGRTK